jgi:uncharacterized protein YukE
MAAPFKVPKGDPDVIRREAGRIGQASADMARASRQVEAHAVTALKGWNGMAAAEFAVTAGGTFTALEVQGHALKAVSQGLKKYADDLQSVQRATRIYIQNYEDDEREIAKPGLSDARKEELKYNLFSRWPDAAENSERRLRLEDSKKATAALYFLAQLKLEKKADPDPKGLLARFLSNTYSVYKWFKTASDPELAFLSLLDAGLKAGTVYQYLKHGVLGKMAQRKVSKAELERSLLRRLWMEGGRGLTQDQLKAQARELAAQIEASNQRVATAERIMNAARPKLAADLGEGLAAGKYAKLAKGLGRASAVLGIIAGVDDIVNNDKDHGWVKIGNYVAGGAGIAGGILVLFASGVGETALVVGLALGTISAGWTLGKTIVQDGTQRKGVVGWLRKHTVDKVSDAWRQFSWSVSHPVR